MINLTTSYTDLDVDQFMFAIKALSFNDTLNFKSSDFQLYASYITQIFDKTTQMYSSISKDYFL